MRALLRSPFALVMACAVAACGASRSPEELGTRPSAPAAGNPASEVELPPPPALSNAATTATALPRPRETGPSDSSVFVVAIDRKGALYANGQPVSSLDELGKRAAAARQREPEVRGVIQADREVPYASVIEVMDQLRQASIQNIALAVAAPPH